MTLVAEGKGTLGADETIPTLTKRFATLGIRSTRRFRIRLWSLGMGEMKIWQPANGLSTTGCVPTER